MPAPPAPTARRVPTWGLGDVVAGLVIGFVASVLVGGIVASAAGYQHASDIPIGVVALLQVPLWLGLFGVPVWAARRKGNGLVDDFGARAQWHDLPVGLAVGVFCQLVVVPLVSWPVLLAFGKNQHDLEKPARDLSDKAHGPGVVLLVLVVVIGAPVIEELFFRGLSLRAIDRRFGPTVALVGSAMLFGFSHFEALQLPALVVFGLVLAWLAQRSGRLGPGIFAHLGFNLTTVILLLARR